MNGWTLLLTSAAVGALVSSVATSVGQFLERKARRRELLLTKSIEMAQVFREDAVARATALGYAYQLQDDIVSAEMYFQWLEHLFEHGALPVDPRIKRIRRDAEGNDIVT